MLEGLKSCKGVMPKGGCDITTFRPCNIVSFTPSPPCKHHNLATLQPCYRRHTATFQPCPSSQTRRFGSEMKMGQNLFTCCFVWGFFLLMIVAVEWCARPGAEVTKRLVSGPNAWDCAHKTGLSAWGFWTGFAPRDRPTLLCRVLAGFSAVSRHADARAPRGRRGFFDRSSTELGTSFRVRA